MGELTNLPGGWTTRHGVVQESGPLLAREVQVQSTQWPDAPNGYGNPLGHSKDNAPVQEDPTAGDTTDLDQGGPLISSLAATETHITNVPAATTPAIFIGDHERILAWVLV